MYLGELVYYFLNVQLVKFFSRSQLMNAAYSRCDFPIATLVLEKVTIAFTYFVQTPGYEAPVREIATKMCGFLCAKWYNEVRIGGADWGDPYSKIVSGGPGEVAPPNGPGAGAPGDIAGAGGVDADGVGMDAAKPQDDGQDGLDDLFGAFAVAPDDVDVAMDDEDDMSPAAAAKKKKGAMKKAAAKKMGKKKNSKKLDDDDVMEEVEDAGLFPEDEDEDKKKLKKEDAASAVNASSDGPSIRPPSSEEPDWCDVPYGGKLLKPEANITDTDKTSEFGYMSVVGQQAFASMRKACPGLYDSVPESLVKDNPEIGHQLVILAQLLSAQAPLLVPPKKTAQGAELDESDAEMRRFGDCIIPGDHPLYARSFLICYLFHKRLGSELLLRMFASAHSLVTETNEFHPMLAANGDKPVGDLLPNTVQTLHKKLVVCRLLRKMAWKTFSSVVGGSVHRPRHDRRNVLRTFRRSCRGSDLYSDHYTSRRTRFIPANDTTHVVFIYVIRPLSVSEQQINFRSPVFRNELESRDPATQRDLGVASRFPTLFTLDWGANRLLVH